MIGKPIVGKSFGGCIRYLVNREEATILEAEGLRLQSPHHIVTDFNMQRKLRPGLGKAVGHTILSWSKEDRTRLTDNIMAQVAREYLEKMGVANTQYLIVKHTDRLHPHLHIVFNRVDNNGRTISDNNNYRRNVQVCRQLTEQYGFHLATGKEQVNRHRLKGKDQVKYAIYDVLKNALKTCKSWQELERTLKKNDMQVHFQHRGNTQELQGVSFEKNETVLKGSAIDRSMSLLGILKQLHRNRCIKVHKSASGKLPQSIKSKGTSVEVQASGPIQSTEPLSMNAMLDLLFSDEHEYAPTQSINKKKKKRRIQR